MTIEVGSYFGAFLVGFIGSTHCIFMCSPIVLALASKPSNFHTNYLINKFIFIALYNLGRVTSYMILGALLGASIASISSLTESNFWLLTLKILSSCIIIGLGLYIANIWMGILKIENLGRFLWKYIAPITSKIDPTRSYFNAFGAGFLWGYIPCGLVYSVLTWALISGSAKNGALIMGSFGLGTLPMLIAMGFTATKVTNIIKNKNIRFLGGILLISLGIKNLVSILF